MSSIFVSFVYKLPNSVEINMGNAEGFVKHIPPTYSDIMEAAQKLASRYGVDKVVITNWAPLSEEEE